MLLALLVACLPGCTSIWRSLRSSSTAACNVHAHELHCKQAGSAPLNLVLFFSFCLVLRVPSFIQRLNETHALVISSAGADCIVLIWTQATVYWIARIGPHRRWLCRPPNPRPAQSNVGWVLRWTEIWVDLCFVPGDSSPN